MKEIERVCKKLILKSWFDFFFKIVLFEISRITQKLRILRGKLNQNVIFVCKIFFQNLLFSNILSTKSSFLKKFLFSKVMIFKIIFFFNIWRVVKSLVQNLTRRKKVALGSDALEKFCFEFWHVVKFLF